MRKLTKTLIMMVTAVMALAFAVSDVEAAQKVYPAQKSSKLYDVGIRNGSLVKNGKLDVVNADRVIVGTASDKYVMYYEKANGTDVKKVKTPTKKSKKIDWKEFTITKDTTFKFKVVKKKATAAQIKKAKTYYVVIKVKNVNPFKETTENVSLDKGDYFGYKGTCPDDKVFDTLGFSYSENGTKWNCCNLYGEGIKINKNCTIKVNAYKFHKKVGTKTYNVTLKTYTKPSKYKFYTVESNWVCEGCQPVAYFSDGSEKELSRDCMNVTKAPEGFKLVEKYNGKSGYNYKLNTTNTYYYELYRARYYKVNGKYEFASWELMEKKTLTYKVWKENFSSGYNGFSGFVAPAKNYTTAGYEGMWVYYKKSNEDKTVYRTFLNPGEALNPDYYWVGSVCKFNGEVECTRTQMEFDYYSFYHRFCSYNAFMEAYNGLHDEVNTYGKVEPTLPPVSPEVPQ